MPTGLTLYAIVAALGLLALGGSWLAGDTHGRHKAELACVTSTATANAKAIEDWQKATEHQQQADANLRAEDQRQSKLALDRAQAVADRFESMRIAIVKMPPKGECTLSPEYLRAFNGAR